MTDDEILTFLVLKYGSLEQAFHKWMSCTATFNDDEDKYLDEHAKQRYPNLKLIRNKG